MDATVVAGVTTTRAELLQSVIDAIDVRIHCISVT